MLCGFATENATPCSKNDPFIITIETLGREKRQLVMLFHDVRNLTVTCRNVRTEVEVIQRRKMKPESNVRNNKALAAMEAVCVKALSHEFINVSLKLVGSRMKSATLC